MDKVLLIIQREYLTRVKKKAFVIMTLAGPLLMAAILVIPVWLSMKKKDSKSIAIVDESGLLKGKFQSTDELIFNELSAPFAQAKESLNKEEFDALLYAPNDFSVENPNGVKLLSNKNLSIETSLSINKKIEKILENQKLEKSGLSEELIKSLKVNVDLESLVLDKGGEEKSSGSLVATVAGYIGGFFIYLSIFIFGAQVMRGVMEEKTNRIVEVIISSVKPFQLMMGKVVGIGLVGLTQYLLWIVLSIGVFSGVSTFFLSQSGGKEVTTEKVLEQQITNSPGASELTPEAKEKLNKKIVSPLADINKSLSSINIGIFLVSFLFFFLFGYLFYGAVFAAIGAAVDNETDSQQFMLPISAPLIIAIIVAQTVVRDPESSISFWFSIIPFTSPIVMLVRVPFGVPMWELLLSMGLLVLATAGITWLAGRIYRVGILMYGKKVTYKELGKWLFYKL